MPPYHRLRHQCAVLVNNAERHARRERRSRALRGAGRVREGERQQMVQVRGGRHRDTSKTVDEV